MTLFKNALSLTAAIALALGLAACSPSQAAPASSGSTEPIKLMGIASVGANVTNYPDIEAGAKAAVDAINKGGGVNGRQIEYSFCNTRGDANQAAACARDAVEEGVAAVVGRADIYSESTTPILEAAGIPDLGAFAIGNFADATSAVSYPLTSGNFANYLGAPYAAKAAGAKKFAIVGVDVSITHTQAELVAEVAADIGYDDVKTIWVPAQGVTDYAPYVQLLKDTDADFALAMLGAAPTQAFLKAAEGVGLETRTLTSGYSFADANAQDTGSAAEGAWVGIPMPNPRDLSHKGVAAYNDELDAAGVANDLTLRRPAGLNAWLAVHAAAQVAETIDGPVTAKSMTSALDSLTGLDVKGVLTWSPGDLGASGDEFPRLPKSDLFVYEFIDGEMSRVDDIKPIPDPLAVIRK